MSQLKRSWQDELAIIDRTMKAISGVSDPEELVNVYWSGIADLLPVHDFVALSRRGVPAPEYLITRSSRFTEDFNPWTQRDRLPRMSGGLLGELAYADAPMVMENVAERLAPDDPARFYLEGFDSLISLPHYDGGQAMNLTVMLMPPGFVLDHSIVPALHWQTSLFGRGTQNLVLRNRLADALTELDQELQVVGAIQRSLLPQRFPVIEGFEIAADYQTSARAGGDYYDFFALDNQNWGLFIADVAGHGTPAAVLMAITHAIAHAQPGAHTPPAALLTYLNNQLVRLYTKSATFVTAFYAVLDPRTKELTYSTAGHNPPRLLRGGTTIALDGAGAIPLGIVADQEYAQACVRLERGDVLLLYTDGVTEAMAPRRANEPLQFFGTARLDAAIRTCSGCSAQACIDRIRGAVAAFTQEAPAADDRTVIAIRCL